MPTGTVLIAAALCVGLLITLMLAAFVTPRQWWRRANARAFAFLAIGTLGIASVLLWMAGEPPRLGDARLAASAPLSTPAAPFAGRSYRVHDDLNLRSTGGVGSPRMVVVPAGSTVVATGEQSGEWWRIKARVHGREFDGWASSLWLRRLEERR